MTARVFKLFALERGRRTTETTKILRLNNLRKQRAHERPFPSLVDLSLLRRLSLSLQARVNNCNHDMGGQCVCVY